MTKAQELISLIEGMKFDRLSPTQKANVKRWLERKRGNPWDHIKRTLEKSGTINDGQFDCLPPDAFR